MANSQRPPTRSLPHPLSRPIAYTVSVAIQPVSWFCADASVPGPQQMCSKPITDHPYVDLTTHWTDVCHRPKELQVPPAPVPTRTPYSVKFPRFNPPPKCRFCH